LIFSLHLTSLSCTLFAANSYNLLHCTMTPRVPPSAWATASSPIPPSVKNTLARLFEILDIPDPTAGKLLAAEVFTADGSFRNPDSVCTGTAEVARCRENLWTYASSRFHEVHKVYTTGTDGTDLILTGTMTMGTKDGTEKTYDFWARVVFQLEGADTAKVKYFEGRPREA